MRGYVRLRSFATKPQAYVVTNAKASFEGNPDPWRVRRTLATGHWGSFWPRQEPRRSHVSGKKGDQSAWPQVFCKLGHSHRVLRHQRLASLAAKRRWVAGIAPAPYRTDAIYSEKLSGWHHQRSHPTDRRAYRARKRPSRPVPPQQ